MRMKERVVSTTFIIGGESSRTGMNIFQLPFSVLGMTVMCYKIGGRGPEKGKGADGKWALKARDTEMIPRAFFLLTLSLQITPF